MTAPASSGGSPIALPHLRKQASSVRITIDATRCTGHGVCARLNEELFRLDRFGHAFVATDAAMQLESTPALRAEARSIAARCPQQAIRVEAVTEPPVPMRRHPGRRLQISTDASKPRLSAPVPDSLEGWLAQGGFAEVDVRTVIGEIEASGIRGQGGARFPVAAKWRSTKGSKPVVVVNAAEAEPGTVKDRYLLERRPYAVIDGIRVAAAAVGASRAVIAVRADHTEANASLRAALQHSAAVLGSLEIEVRTVGTSYLAGEETAILATLEGRAALPRKRPPYPTTDGLNGAPTIVHNVETIVQIALVSTFGSEWYRSSGTESDPGTGLFSVGRFGGAAEPFERPYGYPLDRLLRDAGFTDGIQAVIVGGWSGGMLPSDKLAVRLSQPDLAELGATLGTKSVQVVTVEDRLIDVVRCVMTHFAESTAKQCPPCHLGLPFLAGALDRLARGELTSAELVEVEEFASTLPGRGACALPDGAIRFLRSFLTHFNTYVDRHLVGVAHG